MILIPNTRAQFITIINTKKIMVKSNEGTKLLHMMRPAIQVIPEIETPVSTVLYDLFRSPSKLNKYGLPL